MKKIDVCWVENSFIFINKKQVPQSIEKNAEFYFIKNTEEINHKYTAYFIELNANISSKNDLLVSVSDLPSPIFFLHRTAVPFRARPLSDLRQVRYAVLPT